MKNNQFWASDIDINVSSFIYGINIAVYKIKNDSELEFINDINKLKTYFLNF